MTHTIKSYISQELTRRLAPFNLEAVEIEMRAEDLVYEISNNLSIGELPLNIMGYLDERIGLIVGLFDGTEY